MMESVNQAAIAAKMDDTLRNFGVQRNNFLLLLSDVACYTTACMDGSISYLFHNLCSYSRRGQPHCMGEAIAVERSFSMLGKILAKDRNFLPDIAEKYLGVCHNYNAFTWTNTKNKKRNANLHVCQNCIFNFFRMTNKIYNLV